MNNIKKYIVLYAILAGCSSAIVAQTSSSAFSKNGNPLILNQGNADPHIRIFGGKAYMYATRDEDPKAKEFIMPDWKIWSSTDLINWKLETTIDPTETYMGPSKKCWATDAVYQNGKYYFYFSNGNINTGVMVGDTPIGPFKDALGKPMLPENLTPIKEYDPTVLIEDDGSAYIAFGHYRSADTANYYFCIAKLSDDMISLAESPRRISINGDANVLAGNDKPTLHKKGNKYYLSAGSHYAIADNVYGPYTKTGNSGNGEFGLSNPAHGNYFDWNNQSFHVWCHFHLGKDVARYRESYITYTHYKDNGEMVDDIDLLKEHFAAGVGQYDANWAKIQAEWYMASDRVSKKEGQNGFVIKNIKARGYLHFPNIINLKGKKTINFFVKPVVGGSIEVRSGSVDGRLLGKVNFKNLTSEEYQMVSCPLKNIVNTDGIYIVFRGSGLANMELDYFGFE